MISIILVNYNTRVLTLDTIKSIYENSSGIEYEIILSDNGSVDGTVAEVRRRFPSVVIVENNANIGFGAANNRAFAKAKGSYILFLNTDTLILNNAIKILHDFMDKAHNKNVACCGALLVDEAGEPVMSSGQFPTLWAEGLKVFSLWFVFEHFFRKLAGEKRFADLKEPAAVDYVLGADMFCRREVLDKLGSFDPDFFMFYEDSELGYRFFNNGYASMIVPLARIVHLGGRSSSTKKRWIFETYKKSEYLFYLKCYGTGAARLWCFINMVRYALTPSGQYRNRLAFLSNLV